MSQSNILMQLITAAGPVPGEGLLTGWEGSIELLEFDWGMQALKDPKGSAAGGLAGAANAAAAMIGLGIPVTVKMQPLKFKKRFDVASAQMHTCLDYHLPVISASITVLHIKQDGRAIHQPGLVLMATQGYFAECSLDVADSDGEKDLIETYTLNFKNIRMSYLKTLGKDNLPTPPFFYPKAL